MPRRYRLGERAVQMQATRERIVEAAIELSIEVGISRATMRQIGLRADVAPGTLRNHFASKQELEEAMVERLTAEGPLPDASIYDGARSQDERVARFIRATGTFMDQSGRLYRMWLREPMVTGPWAEAGARYGQRWAELQREALGSLADDADVQAVFRAILSPPFFDAVRGDARTTEQASGLITAMLVPWLDARWQAAAAGDRAR
jgi:AcrR family transcriptional regulator